MPFKDAETRRAWERTEDGRARHKRAEHSSKQRHPERYRARRTVQRAVAAGRLVPWPVCAIPACECTTVEAHHADYERPMDIVWLCAVHHRAAHRLGDAILRSLGLDGPPKTEAIKHLNATAQERRHKARALRAVSLTDGSVLEFASSVAAKRAGFVRGPIYAVLQGQRPSHKGYVWSYADSPYPWSFLMSAKRPSCHDSESRGYE